MFTDRPHIIPLALMLITILAASPNVEAQVRLFRCTWRVGKPVDDVFDNGQIVVGRASLVVETATMLRRPAACKI